jgi:TonB family protein
LILASLLALGACGGAHPPPPVAAAPHPDARVVDDDSGDDDTDDGLELQGTRGHLDPAAVQAALTPHAADLEACYKSQVGKRRWLGGKVELKWQIGADGAITSVQVATSDLGAWPIEKCLLEIAREVEVPKPRGGPADFTIPFEFSAKGAVSWWDEDTGQSAVKSQLAGLRSCDKKHPAPRDAVVTAYVGTRGQVQSVGFASTADASPGATGADAGPIADAWAECAAAAITGWQLPDPRGQIAKLSFRYPAP